MQINYGCLLKVIKNLGVSREQIWNWDMWVSTSFGLHISTSSSQSQVHVSGYKQNQSTLTRFQQVSSYKQISGAGLQSWMKRFTLV